jgi:thioredoxin reductase
MQEKVAYRLLEPEAISKNHVMVVGGGDSAVESALLLKNDNHVTLSYRGDAFNRIKTKNNTDLKEAVTSGKIDLKLNSNLLEIGQDYVKLLLANETEPLLLKNDMVYIFAGGELPTQFLEKAGIKITKKFGEIVRKH